MQSLREPLVWSHRLKQLLQGTWSLLQYPTSALYLYLSLDATGTVWHQFGLLGTDLYLIPCAGFTRVNWARKLLYFAVIGYLLVGKFSRSDELSMKISFIIGLGRRLHSFVFALDLHRLQRAFLWDSRHLKRDKRSLREDCFKSCILSEC